MPVTLGEHGLIHEVAVESLELLISVVFHVLLDPLRPGWRQGVRDS